MATQTRRKRCSGCGELKENVEGRQRLCEDCEEGKDYCAICDEWLDRCWEGCRHVVWSSGLYVGCGSTLVSPEDHHDSFVVLLQALKPLKTMSEGKPLLPALRKQIAKHAFFTQWHGPLIGQAPDLSLRYEAAKDIFCSLAEIPYEVQEGWGETAIAAMQLGMAWLTSLDDRTKSANKKTAEWIDGFLLR